MADPHALYVVTAIVVLGLVVWVGIVLSRPAPDQRSPASDKQSPSQPASRTEVEQGDTKS
jgi:hypothetical protein